jgi:hypothetical protein
LRIFPKTLKELLEDISKNPQRAAWFHNRTRKEPRVLGGWLFDLQNISCPPTIHPSWMNQHRMQDGWQIGTNHSLISLPT